jgi:hypothetical protein
MSADLPIKLEVTCLHMRHKMMFCDERHAEFGRVDTNPERHHVFYCSKTQESLGPDNNPVSVAECCPSRACYRPPIA